MSYERISALLLFSMAALQCGTSQHTYVINGNCNGVIRLPCNATDQAKTYRYVVWYKIGEYNNTSIIKKKGTDVTRFKYPTNVSLGEKETLELQNVEPSDSGRYKCYLAAEIGGQNHESYIGLNISECGQVSTVYPATIIPSESCPAVTDLSFPWAAVGLFLISVTKIIFCIITVGVCDQVIFRARRKKQQEARGSMNGTSSSCKDQTRFIKC